MMHTNKKRKMQNYELDDKCRSVFQEHQQNSRKFEKWMVKQPLFLLGNFFAIY